MGCCGTATKKDKLKQNATKTNARKKSTKPVKTLQKANLTPDRAVKNQISEDQSPAQTERIKNQSLVKSTPPNEKNTPRVISPVIISTNEQRVPSLSMASSGLEIETFIENIRPVSTLSELQTLVAQNPKPTSIVLFYGKYCPYSQRTRPGLRQWAKTNSDRIFLYEADVDQASQLAEHYHVRTIPTVMAFNDGDLLAPTWQRMADNIASSDSLSLVKDADDQFESEDEFQASTPRSLGNSQLQEIFRQKIDGSNDVLIVLDPSLKGPNRILKMLQSPNDNSKHEQYLIILDENETMPNKSKLMLAITNEDGQAEFLRAIDKKFPDQDSATPADEFSSKSLASSKQQRSYHWGSVRHDSQQSHLTEEQSSNRSETSEKEYNGRMASQSAMDTMTDEGHSETNEIGIDSFDRTKSKNPQQIVYLTDSNEIHYEKQSSMISDNAMSDDQSYSLDRFSTITHQQVKEINNRQAEICILYLGPDRRRGFEENDQTGRLIENHHSKVSLLTLKSNGIN